MSNYKAKLVCPHCKTDFPLSDKQAKEVIFKSLKALMKPLVRCTTCNVPYIASEALVFEKQDD